jgi:hypothetical protein
MFSLSSLFITIPFIVFLIILSRLLSQKPFRFSRYIAKSENSPLPYLKKHFLLTRAEKDFYDVLLKVVGSEYATFSKVRMADLFFLPSMDNRSYYHYFGKIKAKHVDFLLCDKDKVEPLLAIELDDSSHSREDRIERDAFVDKLFEEAKLPILHIRAAASYDENELLNRIKSAISTPSVVQV